MAQGATTTPPKFYTIESAFRPGYCITQQGTQLVLNYKNPTNPFQLWYIDDSWSFLGGASVFINQGSKKALKSHSSNTEPRPINKATVGDYDPAVPDDLLLWSYDTCNRGNETAIRLHPVTSLGQNDVLQFYLGHGSWNSSLADGVPVTSSTTSMRWNLVLYEPTTSYKIQSQWFTQTLTSKQKLLDFTATAAVPPTHNDEHTVVAIHPVNQLDGMAWYKIPAGGKDDTTFGSSFIILNRSTGFALKGSKKSGDKVILTQYDPLDYGFVWSENRASTWGGQQYIFINLDGTTLQWYLENDDEYQNGVNYHPLTLLPAAANVKQAWAFVKN